MALVGGWPRPGSHTPKSVADVATFLGRDASPPTCGGVGAHLITGVSQDSREVVPGDLYLGLPGAHAHGGDFADRARLAGAVAMVSDRPSELLPTIVVADPRRHAGPLASWVYDRPSERLTVLGVTGTNGKTSTAHLLAAGLTGAGRRTGLAGTVELRIGDESRQAIRTTAEAADLQRSLATMREDGVTDAVVEVSSHGLALHRVDGTTFQAAIFTNLSRDHLDFHVDLESYFAAKRRLFEPERCGRAVVNLDDDHGRRLVASVRCPVTTYSGHGQAADWRATQVRATAAATELTLTGPRVERRVRLRLLGAHQADNAVGAIACLAGEDVDLDAAIAGMEALAGVPGRLERIDAGQPFLALVDYAHNPGAIERMLATVRSMTEGRVIVVIGASGDRDAGKRAPIGAAAARGADLVIVTDEHSYTEDPGSIRDAVADGARGVDASRVAVQADRAAAFERAVEAALPGDTVVVTGRGHQPIQEMGTDRRPFSDRAVLAAAIGASARCRSGDGSTDQAEAS